jgi:hypothetical protein
VNLNGYSRLPEREISNAESARRPCRIVERPGSSAGRDTNDADSCDLFITGTLMYTKRDPLAKWDNLRISTIIERNRVLLHASINIPHRERLKLKAGTRYRFTIGAHKPFGARELWVIDAKR